MSIQSRAANLFFKNTLKPILTYTPFTDELIWVIQSAVRGISFFSVDARAKIDSFKLKPGFSAEWVVHNNLVKKKLNHVCLFLHGGGYVTGSPLTHRSITSHISKYANCAVLAIDYRKAPNHKYPAALEDAMFAYKWLLAKGYSGKDISISGDSAGGNLTLCLTQKIIEEGLEVPSSIVCFSPWCDLTGSSPSMMKNRYIDPMIPNTRIREASLMYAGDVPLESPKLSPINIPSFESFPPTMFQCGELEILEDELKKTFAKIQATSKNLCVYKEWKDCGHVFQLFTTFIPEAKLSLKETGLFMVKHFFSN